MHRDHDHGVDRRTVIGLLGSGAAIALAGCAGDGDEGSPTPEPTPTDEPTPTETPTPEPLSAVDVPDDASCAVCKMKPAEYPDWNAQLAHEDETRAFFCSAGCAVTYYAVPDEFADTDAAIAGVWMTDVETRETIDGEAAHYALETKGGRLDDPMMVNPAPFADRADAVDYVEAVDYLTEEDIVELEAFDRELATQYRSRFLE